MGLAESWVVVDVDTTGLSFTQDRIIEIGAGVGKGRVIACEFHSLVAAGNPIHCHAQKVHGITAGMLLGQPNPKEVFTVFHRFLGPISLVAHNAPFDVGFLQHEFERFCLSLSNRYYCTLRLSRQYFPQLPNHRLETVFQYLAGIVDNLGGRHRALGDARMAAFV